MCLVIFAHQTHPKYPLVVAANRDEFYARPTQPAAFWPEHPAVLAGKDLDMGGTWMGITKTGRFAAITNYRDPQNTAPAPRSRGELPLDFLCGNQTPQRYLHSISAHGSDYAGFNLLLGHEGQMWYFTNDRSESAQQPRRLDPGIYGLSNARLDTPWPKVSLGTTRLGSALGGADINHSKLRHVVQDSNIADTQELLLQGMSSPMEQRLSGQFICAPEHGYGTRSTTTLWLEEAHRVQWSEQNFDSSGANIGISELSFVLQKN